MKVILDTNILLDIFFKREPFYNYSVICLALVEKENIEGWICGTTVNTLSYLLQKELTSETANDHIESILKLFNVSVINKKILKEALYNGFSDYEDAVLYQSALHSRLDGIVTRNKKDFRKSQIAVYTPNELIKVLDILE